MTVRLQDASLTSPRPPSEMEPLIRQAWQDYPSYSVRDAASWIRSNFDGRPPASREAMLTQLGNVINSWGPGCPVTMTLWTIVAAQPENLQCSPSELCGQIETLLMQVSGNDGVLTPDDVVAYYQRTHPPAAATEVHASRVTLSNDPAALMRATTATLPSPIIPGNGAPMRGTQLS